MEWERIEGGGNNRRAGGKDAKVRVWSWSGWGDDGGGGLWWVDGTGGLKAGER